MKRGFRTEPEGALGCVVLDVAKGALGCGCGPLGALGWGWDCCHRDDADAGSVSVAGGQMV